ncbi:hypothetical protein DFS34DRAFT_5036 [Phlyctochytrium arcticum]|nr:hypothetical protein DFS34DRAFT_5036 [Phlyctochytrium arcticum]
MGRTIEFHKASWIIQPKEAAANKKQKTEPLAESQRAPEDEGGSDNESNDSGDVDCIALGGGDSWPCYWRPWFIAAYRMVASKPQEQLECPKELALKTILACCPPNYKTVDNSNVPCGNAIHCVMGVVSPFGGMRGGLGSLGDALKPQDMVVMNACMDANNRTVLDAINVDSLVELALLHQRTNLPSSVVKRVAATLTLLNEFIPTEAKHLEGTPYAEFVDSYYQLADERWEDLYESFKKAAQNKHVFARIL